MKHLLPAPAFYLQLKIIADLCGTSGYNRKPDNFVAPSPDCDSKQRHCAPVDKPRPNLYCTPSRPSEELHTPPTKVMTTDSNADAMEPHRPTLPADQSPSFPPLPSSPTLDLDANKHPATPPTSPPRTPSPDAVKPTDAVKNMMQKMHYDGKSLGQSCPGIRKLILAGPIIPRPSSLHKPVSIQSLLHPPKRFVLAASNEPPIPLSSDHAYKAALEAGIAQALEANRRARDDIEYANFQIADLQARLDKLSPTDCTTSSPTTPESPRNNPHRQSVATRATAPAPDTSAAVAAVPSPLSTAPPPPSPAPSASSSSSL